MTRLCSGIMLAIGILATAQVAAREPAPIGGVRRLAQLQCDTGSGAALNWTRHSDEAAIVQSGRLALGDLGYRVEFDAIPDFAGQTASLLLHDAGRGTDDSYVLFSGDGLAPYGAAYVITRMQQDIPDPGYALNGLMQHQRSQAGEGRPSFVEANTPFGQGVEMIVGGRVGSACFPTSGFRYAQSQSAASIGISRFAIRGPDIIEYALVLPWPDGVDQTRMIREAQQAMDRFQRGLKRD